MFYHAKNGSLCLDNTHMDYISFGNGAKKLIMLPGLGDGLRSVKGMALPFSVMYRRYAKERTVYLFSRKRQLEHGCTTGDMADDVARAMELLGLDQADVLGVSHGGMVAQQLAIRYPEKVGKLILVVTAARRDPHVERALSRWRDMAADGRHKALMMDNLTAIYSDAYIKRNRWMVPFVGAVTKPASYDRFITMAEAGIQHDCFAELPQIQAQTLVIGGERDQVVSPQASRDLAAHIPGARLVMYPELGHSLYEEAKDYPDLVLDFLNQ